LIAGLYLPQLLKLKVGVIEIEKNAPAEISNITTLGIKREMQTTYNIIHSGVIDLPGYSSSI
jgi:hypothetical protein